MAKTGAIRAGRAFVELFADDSALVRGLQRARYKLQRFGRAVSAMGKRMMMLGVALAAPLVMAVKAFSSMGDRLEKLAKRTGMSVEALSALQFAAERSGTSLEAIEKAVKRMAASIYDLSLELSTSVDAFNALGLSLKDLQGLKPEAQFKLIARQLRDVEDATLRSALAQRIFGRSGVELLPMLDNLEALCRTAEELGLIISTEDAVAAARFTDRMGDLWKIIKLVGFSIGAAMAPVLEDLAVKLLKVGKQVREWVGQNRGLFKVLLKVVGLLIAGGAALFILGNVIGLIALPFGVLATVLSIVSVTFGALIAVLGFLVSPIGLVVAALVGLGAVLLKVTGFGGKVLDWLAGKFKWLRDSALKAFGGIKDALIAGDISLAAKILWLSLKLVWKQGTQALKMMWKEFTFGITAAWAIATNAIASAWTKVTYFLKRTWTKFATWWKTAQEKVSGWVADRMLEVHAKQKGLDKKWLAAAKAARKAETGDHLDDIEREEKASLDALSKGKAAEEAAHQKRLADLAEEHTASIAAMEAEAAKARTELDAAIAAAKQGREAVEGEAGAGLPAGMPDILAGAGAATGAIRGTFSPWATFGMGAAGGNVQDKILTANERTAKATEKLTDREVISFG